MRGVEGEVEIEGFVRALLVDVFYRITTNELGCVAIFLHRLVIAKPVEHTGIAVRVIIQLPDHRAVLVIETTLLGPIFRVGVAEMPLADDRRGVTGALETLRHEILRGIEAVTGGAGDDNRLQAVTERITARHQHRARRRTHRLHVELRELRPARRQRVNARRLDVRAAIEADILPAKIVGHNVDDVGFIRCGSGQSEKHREQRD